MQAFLLAILEQVHLLEQFQARIALGVQDFLDVAHLAVIVHEAKVAGWPVGLAQQTQLILLQLLPHQFALKDLTVH